jgi:poly-gamma-glutamate synthesis protein (capsule biosynthesis protein)
LPQELTAGLSVPQNTLQVSDRTQADFTVDVSADHPLAQWIYVVAAPFDTVADGISFSDLQALWQGTLNDNLPVDKLIMSSGTKSIFEKLWGSASGSTVDVVSDNAQLDVAWGADKTWAIIPFEQLEPKWKVIAVDNQSPIQKAFNADAYNLKVPFSLIGNNDDVAKFVQAYGSESSQPMLPATNRDPNKLTTVVVTGVTALVRGTAYLMQKNGMTYPAIDIGDTLRDADILHISNEIPFTDTCPNPFTDLTDEANLVFCSKPEYIQLLESIGTDVVELTGDHFRDWGPMPC